MSSNTTACITTVGPLCTVCRTDDATLCAGCIAGYTPNTAGTACVADTTTTTTTRAATPTTLPTTITSVAAVQTLYVALMTLCLIIVAMFVR